MHRNTASSEMRAGHQPRAQPEITGGSGGNRTASQTCSFPPHHCLGLLNVCVSQNTCVEP